MSYYNPFDPFISSSSTSTQNNLSLFLNYPETLLDKDNELLMNQFLSPQQETLNPDHPALDLEINNQTVSPVNEKKEKKIARRRGGKKDRHSKIYTAQGPRDRRMRLSLQIARKFFDLQDMLGFDKASSTIEWLFSKSKASITELKENFSRVNNNNHNSNQSPSDYDNGNQKNPINKMASRGNNKKSSDKRESRDKARARARERTMEKLKLKELFDHQEPNPSGRKPQLGFSSQEEKADHQEEEEEEEEETSEIPLVENEMDSVSIIEKFLGISSNPVDDFQGFNLDWSSSNNGFQFQGSTGNGYVDFNGHPRSLTD